MLIQSPMKKEEARPNRRKAPGTKKRARGTGGRSRNGDYGRPISQKKNKQRKTLPGLKPWKVILGALLLGAVGILYLNHLFATQQLLQEVQQLEGEYTRTKRLHNDYKLTYDRMTGPSEIYEKAKMMGFINGGPAEKVLEVEE